VSLVSEGVEVCRRCAGRLEEDVLTGLKVCKSCGYGFRSGREIAVVVCRGIVRIV
jgi:predicted Zn-ribbon and HTH transcriptional regulator